MFQRLTLAAVLVLSLFMGTAQAQETTLAFYLVPKIGAGTFFDTFRPKYIGDFGGPNDPMVPPAVVRPAWSAMDLGIEPTFIVGANLTAEQHAFVGSQPDVFVLATDLDAGIGGNPTLNRVRNGLEQRNIPSDTITATTTTRQIIGIIGRNCLLLQRLNGRHQRRLFEPGVSLDSLPSPDLFSQLVDVGASFGLNTSALSLDVTVRTNILALTSQLPAFSLAGEVF